MTYVAMITGTAARAIAIGTIGAAACAPALLAQNSYNVRAEGRAAAPTQVTRTSAMMNAWIQNPSGQQSRVVFAVGPSPKKRTKTVVAGRWSTSRAPRRVSGRARGLRPNEIHRQGHRSGALPHPQEAREVHNQKSRCRYRQVPDRALGDDDGDH
jgi:hypothetical protein